MDNWIRVQYIAENDLEFNGSICYGESSMFKDNFDIEPYNDSSVGILRHKDNMAWNCLKYMDISQVNEEDI